MTDIYSVLQPEQVVNARNVYGGTATAQVAEAIVRAETELEKTAAWTKEYIERSR